MTRFEWFSCAYYGDQKCFVLGRITYIYHLEESEYIFYLYLYLVMRNKLYFFKNLWIKLLRFGNTLFWFFLLMSSFRCFKGLTLKLITSSFTDFLKFKITVFSKFKKINWTKMNFSLLNRFYEQFKNQKSVLSYETHEWTNQLK